MKQTLCQRLNGLTNDQAKAEAILSLPKRSIVAPRNRECLLTMLASESKLIQFVTARALARTDAVGTSEQVLPVLLSLLIDAKPVVQAYKPIEVRGYDAISEMAISLCFAGKEQPSRVLPVLLDVLDQYSGFNAAMLAHALLWFAFEGSAVPKNICFQQMALKQQQVLLRIASSTRAWRYGGNLAESLTFFGLPTIREALQQFCGA